MVHAVAKHQQKPPAEKDWQHPLQKRWNRDESQAALKKLSSQIDIDAMRVAFIKYAGPDELMDKDEFARFAKQLSIAELAPQLWNAMDRDNSGTVDKREFLDALNNLTTARAWLRYCPICMFENDCALCDMAANCSECTDALFCHKCWNAHAGSIQELTKDTDALRAQMLGRTPEQKKRAEAERTLAPTVQDLALKKYAKDAYSGYRR